MSAAGEAACPARCFAPVVNADTRVLNERIAERFSVVI
mgnify:CR=1 FL=1